MFGRKFARTKQRTTTRKGSVIFTHYGVAAHRTILKETQAESTKPKKTKLASEKEQSEKERETNNTERLFMYPVNTGVGVVVVIDRDE